jgi:hypothetical protein
VAVLTYLRRILESLDHPDMINLILHYLLALPEAINPSETDPHTPIGDARRRKSKDLATMVASTKGDNAATPLLFNLVDLVLACLRSRNQQTIQTTLQLVSAILKRHHRYAVITLLRTEVLPLSNTHRTIGAHEQEVQYLMDLAGSVGGQDNFDDVYDDTITSRHKAADATAGIDDVTNDLRIGHLHDLEMFHWFIRAHLESASGAIPEK